MTTKRNDLGATTWQMTLMALRYLSGRKLRTVLTTLAIVFGVALIFAINLVLPSAVSAFKQNLSGLSGADITISSITGESFEPDAVLPLVTGVEHVTAATGILRRQFNKPASADDSLGATNQLELVGIDPVTAPTVRQFTMSEGRFFEPNESGAAIFPAGIADLAPQIKLDTTFPLITAGGLKIYSVVGLIAEQGNPTTPQIYVTLSDAQAAFNQPGMINTVEAAIDPNADRDAVGAAILQALGSGYQLNAVTDATGTFSSLQIGLAVMNLFGVVALFLGAFLIFNTFRTVIIERRHDLAMLRAIGATQRQITLMIVIESLLQGVFGTLIGLLVGYLMTLGVVGVMSKIWSTYLHMGDFKLTWNASALLTAAGLGLLTSLIAGYLPARAAGRTSPLEALRPTSAASVFRAARWSLIAGVVVMGLAVLMLLSGSKGAIGGALLFLIGMVIAAPGLVLPAARLFSPLLTLFFAREGDLARGNLVRQPGRAAITSSTLMIGLAVLIMMFAVVDGFGGLLTTLADRNFSSDIMLMPQSIAVYSNVIGADASLGTQLRALPEVETVGSLRYAASSVNGKALQLLAIDPVEYPKVASLEFSQGEAETVFAALGSGRNVILTALAQSSLGVQLGDEFTLQTAEGPQTYQVAGVASDLLTFKVSAIFISQANLAADFHKTEDIMLMLTLKPDADKAAVLAQVESITKDYPQFTAYLTGKYRDDLLAVSSGAFSLFYMLAFLILIPAALGLLNTLTINILERTREIGVVRAVGGSRTQVRRMVMGEALLLGIFSAAMGVLAGVAISYGFIMAFSTIGWNMTYIFPIMGIIAAVVIGILLALFAAILPARHAARLEIINALQYQ
jgi:putative ABC transport system permease protein